MCSIRFHEETVWDIIYVWSVEEGKPLDAETEVLRPGVPYEVSIYDTDGRGACLQFPQGEIAIGVPVAAFAVITPCGSCDDPAVPDLDRTGPLGAVPRWNPERWAAETELLRLELEKWRRRHGLKSPGMGRE